MAAPSECSFRARIAFCIFGIISGVSIFCTFGPQYNNWNTALWGLVSGIGAAIVLYIHIQYKRSVWQIFHYRLRSWMLLGCFIQLAGVCGFVAYMVLGAVEHQGLTPYGNGYYLTTVWCFMTWKWGFAMLYFARGYKQLYTDVYMILPQNPKDGVSGYYSDTMDS